MASFTKDEIAKLGNTFIYLCDKCGHLNKTRALKLLYLIEETSVRYFHVPFLGLQYEAWQYGPVQKDIFYDITEGGSLLNDYIKFAKDKIRPKKEFCDDEFSDNDIAVLEKIVTLFGNKTAKELVEITHQKDSLWYKVVTENNIKKDFEERKRTTSCFKLDFSEILSGCEKSRYKDSLEAKQFSNEFKN